MDFKIVSWDERQVTLPSVVITAIGIALLAEVNIR
jgi:hypothetical protein